MERDCPPEVSPPRLPSVKMRLSHLQFYWIVHAAVFLDNQARLFGY
jgi:hypothetical protein